jgi:hypothetical protein
MPCSFVKPLLLSLGLLCLHESSIQRKHLVLIALFAAAFLGFLPSFPSLLSNQDLAGTLSPAIGSLANLTDL